MTDEASPPSNPSPEDRLAELERRLVEQEATSLRNLPRAELKTLAVRAGMVDLDGQNFLDIASFKLDSKGELEHADRIMTDLRRAKPWLFQSANSSTTAPTPPATPPAAKRATAMSHAEWQSARTELLRHR
jgi:hypothetical protein